MIELFSKKKTHKELVQRTEKLLSFLMTMGKLNDEYREMIWLTTDYNDFEMKQEILKSLQGSAPHMNHDDRVFFMNKLLKIP